MSQPRALLWLALAVLTVALYLTGGPLSDYPGALVFDPTDVMNRAMTAFLAAVGPVFRWIGGLLEWPVWAAQNLLQFLPWSVTATLLILLGFFASGTGLAVFAGLACLYMAVIGQWAASMNTLALVLISVPMAVAVGFGFGVWAYASDKARRVIMPMLDLLQTIPAFAYLLPILILFGFGTTVGLVASVLYAFSPMVRNTALGLRSVPQEIVEAGIMSGATPGQLFWKVRIPAAQRQMLLGLNQTTMAALSMVIIASIIGGTNDIGWEVLQTMRKAQFGESLLAGFVIALIAMVLDRISHGFAERSGDVALDRRALSSAAVILAGVALASLMVPALRDWPEAWRWDPAPAMNAGLEFVIVEYRALIEGLKNTAFFYLMLPIKIGLAQAVSPFTWGFAMTPLVVAAYCALALAWAAWLFTRRGAGPAAALVMGAAVLFVGLTNMPWLALGAILVALAWVAAGRGLALGTGLAVAFLLITDTWGRAVLSLYLCGVAVILCGVFGTLIGIAAAQSAAVSRAIRPVLDTLQTMPLFVILIPFVMVFKIGEFTALLAIIAYAIVPAIRYTEHGLRSVSPAVIEAAETVGCSRWQVLTRVKLPLASPAIMLGLNQTIIYAIGMLVIAALVGTNGLGQQIYIGLGDGDFGVGMTAGIGMAIIAIIADRMTQAISRKWQAQVGVTGGVAG